jgi:hypothetical protein
MKKFEKASQFTLTALDKEILTYARYDIDLWAQGYFDETLFPFQRYFYHAPQKDKLLIAGIRTGKSHFAARGAMHMMQFNPGSRFLNTSISSEQAKIVYQACLQLCNAPRFSHWIEHVQSSPYPLIRLVNGSELWFRSIGYDAELIRGFEFDLISVDEAAYVTRETAIKTLRGRLLGINPITHQHRMGILWMISSPKGQGWLAERWKKGDPAYRGARPDKYLSLRATIWDNPLLDQEAINDVMADYTEAMIRQELFGEFLDNSDAFFPYHAIMACCSEGRREVKWLYERINEWNETHDTKSIRTDAGLTEDILHYECDPQAGHRYVASWDLGKKSTQKGRNACVGLVYDITHEPWIQVAFLYREGMGYVEAKAKIEEWHAKYSSDYAGSTCKTVIDSTGKGDVLEEFMLKEQTIDDLEGIVYSGEKKPNLLHAGKLCIERGLTVFPFIKRTVDQLSNYTIYDKDIAQDIVMAYCQMCYAARDMTRMSPQSESLQQKLNAMPHYSIRHPQARLNARYIESRVHRRQARQQQLGGTRHR